jgi:hypothetical protein
MGWLLRSSSSSIKPTRCKMKAAWSFVLALNHFNRTLCVVSNNAAPRLFQFNRAIGQRIAISGFLRCSFDNPGFERSENAHIFEIHPVRTVEIGGELHSFELDVAPSLIQDRDVELNELDECRVVRYWKRTDTLVFSNVEVENQRYIRVAGIVSDIKLNVSANRPAWFILRGPSLAGQLKVTFLQGTRAARRLRELNSTHITLVGLRSIDLARALEDRYRINLLAIDNQPA